MVPSRKQATHKPSGAKGSLSGPKRVPGPLLVQHSSDSHRQHYSSCLYKQRRGDEVWPFVCPSVENPDLVCQETGNSQSSTHPRPAECDSRQIVQTRPDHPDRMIPSPRGLPSHMLPVAPAPSGPVCHQVQQHYHSLCHRFKTPRAGQWMHTVCPGKIWTHMPSHQQPSWAK